MALSENISMASAQVFFAEKGENIFCFMKFLKTIWLAKIRTSNLNTHLCRFYDLAGINL